MPNKPKTKIRGIRVDDEPWEDFMAAAAANGVTASEVARRLFAEYVAEWRQGDTVSESSPATKRTASAHVRRGGG